MNYPSINGLSVVVGFQDSSTGPYAGATDNVQANNFPSSNGDAALFISGVTQGYDIQYLDNSGVSHAIAQGDTITIYQSDGITVIQTLTVASLSVVSYAVNGGGFVSSYHCVATDPYVPPDYINLVPGNVKSGIIIAGVTGNFIGIGPGSGAYSVTIQASTEGSGAGTGTGTGTAEGETGTAVAGATIRVTQGGTSYALTADGSGEATFGLDAGAYTVTITKTGYVAPAYTIHVTGNSSFTAYMVASTVQSSDAGLVTGYLYTYDNNGVLASGVNVELALYYPNQIASGQGFDTTVKVVASDVAGLVQFSNLTPGATYMIRRGVQSLWQPSSGQLPQGVAYQLYPTASQNWQMFTVPLDATSPYALPEVWGQGNA